MSTTCLKRLTTNDLPSLRRDGVDADTLSQAADIVERVRQGGDEALRELAHGFGDMGEGSPLILPRALLDAALAQLDEVKRGVLERTATRIRAFAEAQLASIQPLTMAIPGGEAGHTIQSVDVAGCYAPGGRFPLPSSVLMTAITARVAGCKTVIVASPKPTLETLAAAALAEADMVLAVGGAQAIAAMAYGTETVLACDAIVGPGNKWVTAAKQLVAGRVRIDMLAGPSELVVLADELADAVTIAADLLAQAEHDPEAMPILITPSSTLANQVDLQLAAQLESLPTADIARAALDQGFVVIVDDLAHGCAVCDMLAPEHLEVLCEHAESVAHQLHHYGGLFIGQHTAEVLGDYGAGPNHTLPTGGTARSFAGLSVFNFIKTSTWMRIDDVAQAQGLVEDAVAMGRMEGLEAHARSALRRKQ